MLNDVEIGWLAGLLEGEGTFGLKRSLTRPNNRSTLQVALKMKDEDIIRRSHEMLGLKCQIYVATPPSPKHSVCYSWQVYGPEAVRIMNIVRPHMGQRRGAKIDELLAMTNLSYHPKAAA